MKEILKKHFAIRLFTVGIAAIVMGFSLSWLILVDLGMDSWSLTNIAISDALGMSLGNWQAVLNVVLLVVVVLFGARNLGFGTLVNMFLVGYAIDFFSWIWSRVLPEHFMSSWGVRIGVLIPALVLFILAVAVYIDMDMGISPIDAIPAIIEGWIPKVSYRTIRIFYDGIVAAIGLLFGGEIGIVTIFMILSLGPAITWVGNRLKERWDWLE